MYDGIRYGHMYTTALPGEATAELMRVTIVASKIHPAV